MQFDWDDVGTALVGGFIFLVMMFVSSVLIAGTILCVKGINSMLGGVL